MRPLLASDLERIVDIDALHSGEDKPAYWRGVVERFLEPDTAGRVGLAADEDGELVGYLLGEVRAFEFGSKACGWVFAVGVEPGRERGGVASALLHEACGRFRAAGITTIRTMVQRDDIPVLSFFRSNGFVGGPFYQLELDIGGDV